ncbi:hypothetical protein MHYP_G00224760 [Metynnis hypsauchen]
MKAEPGDWLSLKTHQSHHSPAGCQSATAIEADPLKCTSPKSAALMGAQGQGDAFPEPRDRGLSGVSAGIKQSSTSLEPALQNESQQGQAQSKLRHCSLVEDDSLTQFAVLYYQHLLVTLGPLFYGCLVSRPIHLLSDEPQPGHHSRGAPAELEVFSNGPDADDHSPHSKPEARQNMGRMVAGLQKRTPDGKFPQKGKHYLIQQKYQNNPLIIQGSAVQHGVWIWNVKTSAQQTIPDTCLTSETSFGL